MAAKKKSTEPNFSAGILVTMSRKECDEIQAKTAKGMSVSQWCRKVLLEAARPKIQKGLF